MPNISTADVSTYTVTMVVDGEVKEVPLSEVMDGSLRQQDYTKKTTDLAEQRKAMEAQVAAIETFKGRLTQDPVGVIVDIAKRTFGNEDPAEATKLLAEHLGTKGLLPATQGATQDADDDWDNGQQRTGTPPGNSGDAEIGLLKGQIAQLVGLMEQMRADTSLNGTLGELAGRYSDFAELKPQVLKYAADNGVNPETAYLAVRGQQALNAPPAAPPDISALLSGMSTGDATVGTIDVLMGNGGSSGPATMSIEQALKEATATVLSEA